MTKQQPDTLLEETTDFLNEAFRNIELPSLSPDDVRDIADALARRDAALRQRVEVLEEAIDEAIKFLGMDRPIDPREILRTALAQASEPSQ